MIELPKWKPTEYGFYNYVGIYRMYLENDGTIWRLEIWEGERTRRKAKKLEQCNFITHEPRSLQRIAFDLLNTVLEKIA